MNVSPAEGCTSQSGETGIDKVILTQHNEITILPEELACWSQLPITLYSSIFMLRVTNGTVHIKIQIHIFPGDINCADVCLLLNIIELDDTYVVVLKVMNYTVLLIRGKCASAHTVDKRFLVMTGLGIMISSILLC